MGTPVLDDSLYELDQVKKPSRPPTRIPPGLSKKARNELEASLDPFVRKEV